MATKDHCLSTINKHETFGVDASKNGQYNSLNLNQNKHCFPENTVSSSKCIDVTNENRKSCNFDENDSQKKREYLSWNNKLMKDLPLDFYEQASKRQKENRRKEFGYREKSLNKNNSTLSLHITAYENAEIKKNKEEEEKRSIKKWKHTKGFLSDSVAVTASFELPRQQERDKLDNNPEVMQFKASQQLFNPNQALSSKNGQQNVKLIAQSSQQLHQNFGQPPATCHAETKSGIIMSESHQSHPTFSGDFIVPKREVFAIFDMAKWYRSEAYDNYMKFIHRINDAVKGLQSNDSRINVNERVNNVIAIFDELEKWVQELPLEDMQEQRFGNKTYRKWYERLQERAGDMIDKLLPEDKKAAKVELLPYLLDSFGNSTRIDYGSGHEVAFLFFIYCLYSVGALIPEEDDKAVVLRLFARYLRFVRLLQSKYRMEPAGSRGVHAIDDYQFAPFIFGSSQLIGNKQRLTPDHYLNAQTVEVYQRDNLFFEAIQYINETKYGPFYEHSNQLYNISAVPNWDKVNSGMFKMYEGECLKKFPVAQHFVFGSILSIKQRECFLQRDEETRRALEKEKEADEKKTEDATKEKHLMDTVKPMDPIEEDPIDTVQPMEPIPETSAAE